MSGDNYPVTSFNYCEEILKRPGRPPWYTHQGESKDAFVIAVCGGSGSGKTTIANRITESLNIPWVVTVGLDSFYFGPISPDEKEAAFNSEYDFDCPDALDLEYAADCIEKLKKGKKVEIPIYDFKTHSRENKTTKLYGANVIIVEGIMALYTERLRNLYDLKIFVDCDSDVRLSRRLLRDTVYRGRDIENTVKQYLKFVKPNYDKYVSGLVRCSDIVVPWNSTNDKAIDLIVKHISRELKNRGFTTRKDLISNLNPLELSKMQFDNVHLVNGGSGFKDMFETIENPKTNRDDFISCCKKLSSEVLSFTFRFLENKNLKTSPNVECKSIADENINCISILRSGEILEGVLLGIKPDVNVGRILITTNESTREPELRSLDLPHDISSGYLFLMDVFGMTGAALMMALKILIDHDAKEENIIIVVFNITRAAAYAIKNVFPDVKIVCARLDFKSEDVSKLTIRTDSLAAKYFGV